jgi:hypothetical protein
MNTETITETDFDFKIEADKLMLACRFLADLDCAALVNTVNRVHSMAPLLDPTAYRDALYRGHMDDLADLARLAIPLVRKFKEIQEKVGPDRDG